MPTGKIKVLMNGWEDLDISNIPRDFFINERYEVEVKSDRTYNFIPIYTDPSNRYDVIKNLTMGTKYRYRLKALKSIRITKDMLYFFTKYNNLVDKPIKPDFSIAEEIIPLDVEGINNKGYGISGIAEPKIQIDGREVEIID